MKKTNNMIKTKKTKKSNIFKVKTSKNKKKTKKQKKNIRNKIKMKGGVLDSSIITKSFMTNEFNIPIKKYELKNSPEDIERYSMIMRDNGFNDESINTLKIVLDNTTHISFDHLIHSIKETIKKFEGDLSEWAIKDKPFYVFIPIIGDVLIENKSNYWISKIFYLLMNKKPIKIITFNELINDKINNNDQIKIKDIILCDDAIYSGEQMSTIFDKFKTYNIPKDKYNFHILCPFISQKGINRLNGNENFVLHFYESTILKPLQELVDEKGQDPLFKQKFRQLIDIPSNRYPYYFDHRVADSESSFPELYELGRVCFEREKCIYLNSLLENCDNVELPKGIYTKSFLEKCPPIPYRPGITGDTPGIRVITPEQFIIDYKL